MKPANKSLEDMDQYIALATKRIEEQRNRVLELRRRGYEQRREHLVERLLLSKGERTRKRAP